MSVTATAAASSAASIINLYPHNHKKSTHMDLGGASDTTTSGQAPATTQGLFSRLLQTVEQVAGVSPLGTAAVAAVRAVTGSTTAATAGAVAGQTQHLQSSGGHSLGALGGTINTSV